MSRLDQLRIVRSIPYRVRQFVSAIAARVSRAELDLVTARLTPAELRLFLAMPTYDQRHCLDVYQTLHAAGHHDPLLLRAALIHDCGKVSDTGHPMHLGWYMVATMLKGVPGLYLALARMGGPFTPIRTYAEHAWRGARMAAAAGSPSVVVTTMRHYHDPAPDGYAALLKWADEQH